MRDKLTLVLTVARNANALEAIRCHSKLVKGNYELSAHRGGMSNVVLRTVFATVVAKCSAMPYSWFSRMASKGRRHTKAMS